MLDNFAILFSSSVSDADTFSAREGIIIKNHGKSRGSLIFIGHVSEFDYLSRFFAFSIAITAVSEKSGSSCFFCGCFDGVVLAQ